MTFGYEDLDPDQQHVAVERNEKMKALARAALVDMGYDPKYVGVVDEGKVGFYSWAPIPGAVKYMVAHLAQDVSDVCWKCSLFAGASLKVAQACIAGECSHPDAPRLPPKSLIVSRPR